MKKVIDHLDMDKNQSNQEGKFTFKTTFSEDNANWDENIWTKRLCGGLNYGNNYNGSIWPQSETICIMIQIRMPSFYFMEVQT